MPEKVPKSPPSIIAYATGPLIWAYGAPDLFDSWAVGAILLQMTIPTIRPMTQQKRFVDELERCDWDLEAWRKSGLPMANRADFRLLDRDRGAGWELAKKLMAPRNKLTNRGRLSAGGALGHRYFRSK